MNDAVYVSAEGLEALKAEYQTLKRETIPDIAQKIDDAKQNGDLSENAEYQDAKEQMAFAQGKLRELENKISNASIITNQGGDSVGIGSTITVEAGGAEKTYQIVGSTEADPLNGKISNESPIGSAFLGHKVGDAVDVEKPAGVTTYTIKSIS